VQVNSSQVERTMLATQWCTKERHERSVLDAEAGRVVAAGPADKRAGAHERLPGTHGRLLLHEREKETGIDSLIWRLKEGGCCVEEQEDVCSAEFGS
jgi:hypothetical protein